MGDTMELIGREILSRREVNKSDSPRGQVRFCLTRDRSSFETVSFYPRLLQITDSPGNFGLDTYFVEIGPEQRRDISVPGGFEPQRRKNSKREQSNLVPYPKKPKTDNIDGDDRTDLVGKSYAPITILASGTIVGDS